MNRIQQIEKVELDFAVGVISLEEYDRQLMELEDD
jgi:hypothetical protein